MVGMIGHTFVRVVHASHTQWAEQLLQCNDVKDFTLELMYIPLCPIQTQKDAFNTPVSDDEGLEKVSVFYYQGSERTLSGSTSVDLVHQTANY